MARGSGHNQTTAYSVLLSVMFPRQYRIPDSFNLDKKGIECAKDDSRLSFFFVCQYVNENMQKVCFHILEIIVNFLCNYDIKHLSFLMYMSWVQSQTLICLFLFRSCPQGVMWNSRLPCSSVRHLLLCPPWPSGPGPSRASCPYTEASGTALSRHLSRSIAARPAGQCSVYRGKLSVDIASARAASQTCSGGQGYISEVYYIFCNNKKTITSQGISQAISFSTCCSNIFPIQILPVYHSAGLHLHILFQCVLNNREH